MPYNEKVVPGANCAVSCVTLIELIKATEDIPVQNIPVKKLESKITNSDWDEEDYKKAMSYKPQVDFYVDAFTNMKEYLKKETFTIEDLKTINIHLEESKSDQTDYKKMSIQKLKSIVLYFFFSLS
jgi:hypothetical protein